MQLAPRRAAVGLYTQNWYCTIVPPVAAAVRVIGVLAGCGEAGEGVTRNRGERGAGMVYQRVVFAAVPVAPSCAVTERK